MNEQPGVNPGAPTAIVTSGRGDAPEPTATIPPTTATTQPTIMPPTGTSIGADTQPPADPTRTERVTRPYPPARPGWGAPISVLAIFGIFLAGGGALIGYALAQALGPDQSTRQYSLIWLLLGAGLAAAGWAIRARRWWGTAATIAAAVDGLVVGMYGFYGLLVIATSSGSGALNGVPGWSLSIGLVAVGAAAIAVVGLLATAWPWLTAPHARRAAA